MIRRLILAAGAVTSRLTGTWSPPASVLEELALRLLLEQAQVIADDRTVSLPEDWREDLEELLFEDMDVQLLYDDPDEIATVILLGPIADHYMPEGWGKPFTEQAGQAPYITGVPAFDL